MKVLLAGEPGGVSMSRFARGLSAALRAAGRVEPVDLLPERLPLSALEPHLTRYARLPLGALARRGSGNVAHVTDHSHAQLAAILGPGRTVVTCHDLILLQAREGTAGFEPRRRAATRFAFSTSFLSRVARVACPTEAVRTEAIQRLGVDPARTTVIPNAVSPVFRPPAGRVARDGAPLLLQVSSGQPYKNTAGILRTLAAVRAQGQPVTLVRAGVPLDAAERALARELGLGGAVRETGTVSDERLAELYGVADVVLFPSHAEGFGWPVLEAMACGTPVVASDLAAVREVAAGAALIAAATDTAALAAAVRRVLEEPGLGGELSRRGVERAGHFTWERTADAYADLYGSVAA